MNRISNIAIAFAVLTAFGGATQSNPKSDFQLVKNKTVQKTDKSLKQMEKQANGKAGANNSLNYSGNAYIVVRTGPEDDMMSFRIQGLRNPTLNVKPGATMKVLFANTDEDMYHCMRFGSAKAPFPVVMSHAGSVGSPDLPHSANDKFSATEMIIEAPATPGTYTYVCTIKGHAKAGMYGQVVVR